MTSIHTVSPLTHDSVNQNIGLLNVALGCVLRGLFVAHEMLTFRRSGDSTLGVKNGIQKLISNFLSSVCRIYLYIYIYIKNDYTKLKTAVLRAHGIVATVLNSTNAKARSSLSDIYALPTNYRSTASLRRAWWPSTKPLYALRDTH